MAIADASLATTDKEKAARWNSSRCRSPDGGNRRAATIRGACNAATLWQPAIAGETFRPLYGRGCRGATTANILVHVGALQL